MESVTTPPGMESNEVQSESPSWIRWPRSPRESACPSLALTCFTPSGELGHIQLQEGAGEVHPGTTMRLEIRLYPGLMGSKCADAAML